MLASVSISALDSRQLMLIVQRGPLTLTSTKGQNVRLIILSCCLRLDTDYFCPALRNTPCGQLSSSRWRWSPYPASSDISHTSRAGMFPDDEHENNRQCTRCNSTTGESTGERYVCPPTSLSSSMFSLNIFSTCFPSDFITATLI